MPVMLIWNSRLDKRLSTTISASCNPTISMSSNARLSPLRPAADTVEAGTAVGTAGTASMDDTESMVTTLRLLPLKPPSRPLLMPHPLKKPPLPVNSTNLKPVAEVADMAEGTEGMESMDDTESTATTTLKPPLPKLQLRLLLMPHLLRKHLQPVISTNLKPAAVTVEADTAVDMDAMESTDDMESTATTLRPLLLKHLSRLLLMLHPLKKHPQPVNSTRRTHLKPVADTVEADMAEGTEGTESTDDMESTVTMPRLLLLKPQ